MSEITDYIVKDYESFRAMMIEELQEILPSYTDTSQTDAGIVIIELLARGLDILSYYQDVYANEALLSTCELRSSALKWCKLLGYTPKEALPSKVDMVFVKNRKQENVTLPIRTQIATSDGVIFETTKELFLPQNTNGNETDEKGNNYLYTVEAVQGYTVYNEPVGVGNGLDNQTFTLKYSSALIQGVTLSDGTEFGTLEVTVISNGVSKVWKRKDSFISSHKDSEHYVASLNESGQIVLTFGSNLLGKVPTSSDEIRATYRVGGGIRGNVAKKTVKSLVTSISGIKEVFNVSAPTLDNQGYEQESLESIKINAPLAFKTLDRAVTLQDHSDLVSLNKSYKHVKSVVAYSKEYDENDENWKDTVEMYVQFYPDFNGDITSALNEIEEFVHSKQMIGTFVKVMQAEKGTQSELNIQASLIVEEGYNFSSVSREIKKVTYKYLSNRALNIGQEFSVVSYEDLIKKVEGVKYFRVTSPTELVTTPQRGCYLELDDTENADGENEHLKIIEVGG